MPTAASSLLPYEEVREFFHDKDNYIDELDRADEPFEAFLLEILSEYQITVPELGTIAAAEPPVVVLTSNRTREVHDALKRRCLYHWVDYPSAERERAILAALRSEAADSPSETDESENNACLESMRASRSPEDRKSVV